MIAESMNTTLEEGQVHQIMIAFGNMANSDE